MLKCTLHWCLRASMPVLQNGISRKVRISADQARLISRLFIHEKKVWLDTGGRPYALSSRRERMARGVGTLTCADIC